MRHIVVLSRGHGYGDAARDLQLIEAMLAFEPNLELTVASSGTGYEYYSSKSVPCVDLGIPDIDDQSDDATCRVLRFLIQVQEPDLVIADEVFSAPGVCRMLGLRNLLLTDWLFSDIDFPDGDRLYYDADAVVVFDSKAAHHKAAQSKVPLHFTGPVARIFSVERPQARAELELMPCALSVAVTVGALREDKMLDVRKLLDTVVAAWTEKARNEDRLFILAPQDAYSGSIDAACGESVQWVDVHRTPERFYCAVDVVFAYATFTTLSELVRNGIPTVALVGALNPIDRVHASYFDSAGYIRAVDIDVEPTQLWSLIQRIVRSGSPVEASGPGMPWADLSSVARQVMSYLPQSVSGVLVGGGSPTTSSGPTNIRGSRKRH